MFLVMYMLYGCVIVVLFSFLFLVIGKMMLNRLDMESSNSYWDIAGSFFIGMAAWLAVLRTLAYFLPSYKLSFCISLILFIIIAVLQIRKSNITHVIEWGGAK